MPGMEDTVPTRAEVEEVLRQASQKTNKQDKKGRNDDRRSEFKKAFKDKVQPTVLDKIESDLSSYPHWEKDPVHPAREV